MVNKLTFNEIMKIYDDIVNKQYNIIGFHSFYITDNDYREKGKPYKPYKLKWLGIYPTTRNKEKFNNKNYFVSDDIKVKFLIDLINIFQNENIYGLC